jgi:hypothetical protein
MVKVTPQIASAAGIAVGGNSDVSHAVREAMEDALTDGLSRHLSPEETKAKMQEARYNAKPPEAR